MELNTPEHLKKIAEAFNRVPIRKRPDPKCIQDCYVYYGSENRLEKFSIDLVTEETTFEQLLSLYEASDRPQAQAGFNDLMDAMELLRPDLKLKKPVRLWRGTSKEIVDKGELGVAWTYNRDIAIWFAKHCCSARYAIFGGEDRTPILLERVFDPCEIIYWQNPDEPGRAEDIVLVARDFQAYNPDREILSYPFEVVKNEQG